MTRRQVIFDHLGAQDKQMLWVGNSGHVVVREPERERIFEAIEEFILRVNSRQAQETR